MKKFIFIFCLGNQIISAQVKGLINFGFVESIGQGNGKGTDYYSYLLFDKNKSYFVTAKDSLEKEQKRFEQKVILDDVKGGGAIYNGMKTTPQGDQVFYDVLKKTIWSNFLYVKQIYVKENATIINWKIYNETKRVGNFVCKKATCFFRGREYTAWFTSNIPVPFGPWKLNGLPGLILEAYDKDKFAFWYFKNVEYPTKNEERIKNVQKLKNEKIVFLSIDEYKQRQIKLFEMRKEKNIILHKEFPNVIFPDGELRNMFLEVL